MEAIERGVVTQRAIVLLLLLLCFVSLPNKPERPRRYKGS